ncbi:hypothetical protein PT974_00561 [Cladobotryum mycophilum]|uniref:Uncharacterized protein n=1 Tax=Cladobotryum mycophilum TaxID=491253 RepID=A0ABR0T179_9HYPO
MASPMSTSSFTRNDPTGKKRKRWSSSNRDGIDDESGGIRTQPFLSQSSHKTAQLELAGLSDADDDPTLTARDFPHRGFSRIQSEEEENPEGDKEHHRKPRLRENDRKGHLDVLLRATEQFLDQGEIEKAARAYGLVLQLRPRSQPIDIRLYNLWAIGAEILMRQGEEQQQQLRASIGKDETSDYYTEKNINRPQRKPTRRWGAAANMGKVKAYFETLVRQYPFDPKFPNKISAVDFWLAMLSCEVYNVHAEYVVGLTLLDEQEDEREDDYIPDDDGVMVEDKFGYEGSGFGDDADFKLHEMPRQSSLQKRRDDLRKLALETMRDIIQRLEKLMEEAPYSKHGHFIRLRATSSLFAADLCVPTSYASPTQLREAETRRGLEQQAAMNAIRELANTRNDTSSIADAVFDSYLLKKEHVGNPPTNLYASLPIREG